MDVQEQGAVGGLPVAEPPAASWAGGEPDTCPRRNAGGRCPVPAGTPDRGRPVPLVGRHAWDEMERRHSVGISGVERRIRSGVPACHPTLAHRGHVSVGHCVHEIGQDLGRLVAQGAAEAHQFRSSASKSGAPQRRPTTRAISRSARSTARRRAGSRAHPGRPAVAPGPAPGSAPGSRPVVPRRR